MPVGLVGRLVGTRPLASTRTLALAAMVLLQGAVATAILSLYLPLREMSDHCY